MRHQLFDARLEAERAAKPLPPLGTTIATSAPVAPVRNPLERVPAITPGMASGRITWRKVRQRSAPAM